MSKRKNILRKSLIAFLVLQTVASTGCGSFVNSEAKSSEIISICNNYLNSHENINITAEIKENDEEIIIEYKKDVDTQLIEVTKNEITDTKYVSTSDDGKVAYYKWNDVWAKEDNGVLADIETIKSIFNINGDNFPEWTADKSDDGTILYTADAVNENKRLQIEYADENISFIKLYKDDADKPYTVVTVQESEKDVDVPKEVIDSAKDITVLKKEAFKYSELEKWDYQKQAQIVNEKTATNYFSINVRDRITRLEIFYDKKIPTMTLTSPSGKSYQIANTTYADGTALTIRHANAKTEPIPYSVVYLETKEMGEWKFTVTTSVDNDVLIGLVTESYAGWGNKTYEIKTLPTQMLFFYTSDGSNVNTDKLIEEDEAFYSTTIQNADKSNIPTTDAKPAFNSEQLALPLLLVCVLIGAFVFIKTREKNKKAAKEMEKRKKERKKSLIISEDEEYQQLADALKKYNADYEDDIKISGSTEPTYIDYSDNTNMLQKKTKDVILQNEPMEESEELHIEQSATNSSLNINMQNKETQKEKQNTEEPDKVERPSNFIAKPEIKKPNVTNSPKNRFF